MVIIAVLRAMNSSLSRMVKPYVLTKTVYFVAYGMNMSLMLLSHIRILRCDKVRIKKS